MGLGAGGGGVGAGGGDIAARRSDIFELILPEANKRDYDELPDYLKTGMTVHFAKVYPDVAKVVFGR